MQIEAGLAFVFARFDAIGHVPWRRWEFQRRGVEINRPLTVIVLPQPKEQMFVLKFSRRSHALDISRTKKRLRIAISKRLEQFVPAQQIKINFCEAQLVINSKARPQLLLGEHVARGLFESFPERGKFSLTDREARRHFVATELLQEFRASTQCQHERKPFDASSASLPCSVLIKTHHNRWP